MSGCAGPRRSHVIACQRSLSCPWVQDEVYDKQFGHIFAQYALNKDGSNVQRDDFAFELADMDE